MGLSPSAQTDRNLVRPSAAGGGKSQTGRTVSQSPACERLHRVLGQATRGEKAAGVFLTTLRETLALRPYRRAARPSTRLNDPWRAGFTHRTELRIVASGCSQSPARIARGKHRRVAQRQRGLPAAVQGGESFGCRKVLPRSALLRQRAAGRRSFEVWYPLCVP